MGLLSGAMMILPAGGALAAAIKFTAISTAFPTPVGIDHYEPTNQVVMSVNYSSGLPNNFRTVAADGTQAVFAPSVSGFTDEVKIATVRSGNTGGFTTGDLFVGNGEDGEIAKVTAGGATVINPFVSLPGSGNGLMRGSLYVDRSGAWGGDLLAATTAGELWRVNSAGAPTFIADVNVHLEGLLTVPNDPKYGPLAGKAIAGAEGVGLLYAFGTDGTVTTHNVGVAIEDIDMINANENFYGVNFGTSKLLGAEASQFAPYVGEILLTQEFPSGGSGLSRLYWDGTALATEQFAVASGSATVAQWEHVTFSPAGIVEIPPTGIPEPATFSLLGASLAGLGFFRRKMNR